jgi:hypothetical protein
MSKDFPTVEEQRRNPFYVGQLSGGENSGNIPIGRGEKPVLKPGDDPRLNKEPVPGVAPAKEK